MSGVVEFKELFQSAHMLIAVQQGEHLQVQGINLHARERMGAGDVAAALGPPGIASLERWVRSKAEEVIRSGQPALGIEDAAGA